RPGRASRPIELDAGEGRKPVALPLFPPMTSTLPSASAAAMGAAGDAGAGRGIMYPMSGTIEIGAVELFVRVAELRSFRAAGDALGVPRSTVSRRVAELESALGTRLLHRTTRHVELTNAGKTYLRACGPALRTIMEAGRALATRSEDTAGRLRVTASPTFAETLLGEAVAECLARHPQ